MLGITKGNKHSYNDFGVTIKSKEVGSAKKKKIKETIPFMNGSYDFSLIYGNQCYEERTLKYVFNIKGKDKIDMNIKKIKILEWLMEGEKYPLHDDAIPGFYFLAECIDDNFVEYGHCGELSVVFEAYPFKLKTELEGEILWDNFNFELDTMQETNFLISEVKEVTLYNTGSTIINPTIECSSCFKIIKDNITYVVGPGTFISYDFELEVGENKFKIVGNGNINFLFRMELL